MGYQDDEATYSQRLCREGLDDIPKVCRRVWQCGQKRSDTTLQLLVVENTIDAIVLIIVNDGLRCSFCSDPCEF